MDDVTGPPTLIDTHAHLASPKLAHDLDRVVATARQVGVEQMVAIATDLADSRRVIEIAERYPTILASVGIHPNETAEAAVGDWDEILRLVDHPRVVALGETGLDRYWSRAPFHLQQEFFQRHLDLSHEAGKPVIIHSRDCQSDVIAQVAACKTPVTGVQHSFTGTIEEADALLSLGLHISFAGMVTFENRTLDTLREVAARIPLDRLLVETDSPYLSPHPFRGKLNEPARVVLTAEVIARQRNLTLAEFAAATTANARRLFRLPDPDVAK